MLEMIEKREQAPRLPVMVLLENDVRDLADAHVYLDDRNPKAARSLDLLLGTQGWRRFAFVDAQKFIQQHGDAARRVLAFRLPQRLAGRALGRGFGGGGFQKGADYFWGDRDGEDAVDMINLRRAAPPAGNRPVLTAGSRPVLIAGTARVRPPLSRKAPR